MLVILLLINLLYNIYVICKFKKIPESLSETAYLFGKQRKYFFTLYCFIISAIILPTLLSLSSSDIQFIPFLFISGLLFAGISVDFKKGLDSKIHYVGAVISFIAFIIFMFINFIQGLIIYTTLLILLIVWKPNCYVYFAEILGILILNIWMLF